MEAPPLPTAVAPPSPLYPQSVDSTPRSRHNEPWDAPEPPPKLRLMCSYGGHIVPRPHDKTLCYIGGDTRIIVIDRHTTLSDLHQRLSKSLLRNEPFSLKYQLPSEDLDSLISVSTDEDLENMVEEYDRLSNSGGKPGRIRFFLFPKSFSGIEQLLVETASVKSEDWFFDTLNGKASLSADRDFSETSSVNCLLGLDDDSVTKAAVVEKDVEAQSEASKIVGSGNDGNRIQDVHSVPDSPMLETTSSFGSASSSPFVANLPPIRVRVEESPKIGGSLGIEEQFQQMSIGVGAAGNVNQQPPPAVVAGVPPTVGSEYSNRVISDDERSDHGGYRKVQQIQHDQMQQLQPQQIIPQYQQKQSNAFDLPSPDSVSSEGSVANSLSRQRQAMYNQDPLIQFHTGNTRNVSSNQVDLNTDDHSKTKVQMHMQAEESGYMFSGQFDQNRAHLHQPQQFVHAGNQYIPAGAVPIASYYPMFRSQQQQQHHPMIDPQYHQIYLMSARQNQSYNLPGQHHPSYGELAPNAPSSRSQMPPVSVTTQSAYNQSRSVPSSKPEMPGDIYRTASPQLVQVPSSHHQAQYIGYTQVHHPSQSMPPSSAANSAYSYEFADTAANAQMYYTPLPPQLAAQYQTMTTASGMVMQDGSPQLPADGIKQQAGNSMP